jgi:hypothetical protein
VVVAAGAERAVVHYDRIAELAEDATSERMPAAEQAAAGRPRNLAHVRGVQRHPALALEAMFVASGAASPVSPPRLSALQSETRRRAQVFSPSGSLDETAVAI